MTTVAVIADVLEGCFRVESGRVEICLGFEQVEAETMELAKRMGVACTTKGGTLEQFQERQKLLEDYAESGDTKTWFTDLVPPAVRFSLDKAIDRGILVRLYYGDADGLDWLEEHDTIGQVIQSDGILRQPMLRVGQACLSIPTAKIVAIQDPATGGFLYKHPTYRLPDLALRFIEGDCKPHQVWGVKDTEAQSLAAFRTLPEAAHWVAFMAGLSHNLNPGDI